MLSQHHNICAPKRSIIPFLVLVASITGALSAGCLSYIIRVPCSCGASLPVQNGSFSATIKADDEVLQQTGNHTSTNETFEIEFTPNHDSEMLAFVCIWSQDSVEICQANYSINVTQGFPVIPIGVHSISSVRQQNASEQRYLVYYSTVRHCVDCSNVTTRLMTITRFGIHLGQKGLYPCEYDGSNAKCLLSDVDIYVTDNYIWQPYVMSEIGVCLGNITEHKASGDDVYGQLKLKEIIPQIMSAKIILMDTRKHRSYSLFICQRKGCDKIEMCKDGSESADKTAVDCKATSPELKILNLSPATHYLVKLKYGLASTWSSNRTFVTLPEVPKMELQSMMCFVKGNTVVASWNEPNHNVSYYTIRVHHGGKPVDTITIPVNSSRTSSYSVILRSVPLIDTYLVVQPCSASGCSGDSSSFCDVKSTDNHQGSSSTKTIVIVVATLLFVVVVAVIIGCVIIRRHVMRHSQLEGSLQRMIPIIAPRPMLEAPHPTDNVDYTKPTPIRSAYL